MSDGRSVVPISLFKEYYLIYLLVDGQESVAESVEEGVLFHGFLN